MCCIMKHHERKLGVGNFSVSTIPLSGFCYSLLFIALHKILWLSPMLSLINIITQVNALGNKHSSREQNHVLNQKWN